ncbi:hypothetical protein BUALT_Bualt08G0023100 [Buddleja alternifolia]|uniref:RRM domain-containing protein n=1 Tax=Buddleja alternifolia TaxID=168488 RepID=A0AAV6XAA9_9LAMI|nr:hypothetical protein BUALT_Bualt08G0023100 [Buddleja alternifolia]
MVKLHEFPFQNIKMVVLEEEEEEQEDFVSSRRKWESENSPDEDESAADKFLRIISNLQLSCSVLRRGGVYSSCSIYHLLIISILKPVIGQNFFKPVGEVVDVRFAIRDDSFRDYGHVEFASSKEAEKVFSHFLLGDQLGLQEMNGKELLGHNRICGWLDLL